MGRSAVQSVGARRFARESKERTDGNYSRIFLCVYLFIYLFVSSYLFLSLGPRSGIASSLKIWFSRASRFESRCFFLFLPSYGVHELPTLDWWRGVEPTTRKSKGKKSREVSSFARGTEKFGEESGVSAAAAISRLGHTGEFSLPPALTVCECQLVKSRIKTRLTRA